jgi:hypothetical protein
MRKREKYIYTCIYRERERDRTLTCSSIKYNIIWQREREICIYIEREVLLALQSAKLRILCVCVCVCVCVCIIWYISIYRERCLIWYTCIYIERERERKRERSLTCSAICQTSKARPRPMPAGGEKSTINHHPKPAQDAAEYAFFFLKNAFFFLPEIHTHTHTHTHTHVSPTYCWFTYFSTALLTTYCGGAAEQVTSRLSPTRHSCAKLI